MATMKIALLGYGKMGRLLDKLAGENGHEVVLRIDENNLGQLTPEAIHKADVAIEFSTPDAAVANLKFCLEQKTPVVCGTTGWLDQLDSIRALTEKWEGAVFYASNFSIGVNLFFELNRFLARRMRSWPEYEPQLEEIHHTQKVDAPSGTALSLANDLLANLDSKESWTLGIPDKPEELGITSRRIGMMPGTHEVRYDSGIDSIIIRHEAHSREGFARGALKAARWIIGKKGVFTMKDMLGF